MRHTPDMTNRGRALRGGEILDILVARHEEGRDVRTETAVVDLLTDLMHYAAQQSAFHFGRALKLAEMHFEEERGEK